VPFEHGLTLAELVRRNAGGRRQLAYGTIAHYLRAVTLQRADGTLLRLGGPTLKRATGYNLQRALVGGGHPWLPDMGRMIDITLNVRPLPPVRRELFIACETMPAACRLAERMLHTGAALSALAVINASGFDYAYNGDKDWYVERSITSLAHKFPMPGSPVGTRKTEAMLLAELEGSPAVLDRQQQQLVALVEQAEASLGGVEHHEATQLYISEWWEAWEELPGRSYRAATAFNAQPMLALNLPRATLPAFIEQAQAVAWRYDLYLYLWGDAGVGNLHMSLQVDPWCRKRRAGELAQAAALLEHMARQMGSTPSTDHALASLSPRLPVSPPPQSLASPSPRLPASPPPQSLASSPPQSLTAALQEILGPQQIITRPDELLCYIADASIAQAEGPPLAAIFPTSTAQVSEVLRLAAAAGVPVVTRGAGSGLAGGAIPTTGALLLTLTQMQRLSINAVQQVAHAEAGVVTADLQRAAEQHGLLYVPDPSSQVVSTIGGNIACNAGGPRCLKYGVTANYVLGLTAVLADGTVVRVGDSIAGQTPDAGLLHLLVGSEGTLAIVTEATMRLIHRPAARRTALALFDRLDDACATVEAIMASGVLPAGLELMDDTCIRVVEDAMALGLPRDAGALLLMLSDGEPEAVEWEAQQLADLAERGGARSVQVAQNASEEAGLWQARRSVSPSFARVLPNKLGEDICVPLPQIASTVRKVKAIAAAYDLHIPVFGHAGDGNLHPNILFDKRDPAQVERVWRAAEEIFTAALDAGGTLSGEHGIGTLKRSFMAAALGPDVLALQRDIKARLDPQGILNPGKVL
jgi:glycolate oxidase subunit GlcD